MKHLSLILSIFVLLLSVVPCSLEDKCLSAYTESLEIENTICNNSCDTCSDNDGDSCSPFLHCNTCFGFPEAHYYKSLKNAPDLTSDCQSNYVLKYNLSDFISSIWQPPRA